MMIINTIGWQVSGVIFNQQVAYMETSLYNMGFIKQETEENQT